MLYSYAAILLLLLAVAPQPGATLYHTSPEILHWFGNAAKDHPGTLKYVQNSPPTGGLLPRPPTAVAHDALCLQVQDLGRQAAHPQTIPCSGHQLC